MQIIKSFAKLLVFVLPLPVMSQTTFLQQGDKAYQLIDRLEIKAQNNTHLNFSTLKPYSREAMLQEVQALDSNRKSLQLTKTDAYNLQRLYLNNVEFFTGDKSSFISKHQPVKGFYVNPANLLQVNAKDFFLAVNPVLQFSMGKQSDYSNRLFLNTRGVTLRGKLANKIGFSATITDNQERGPLFFRDQVYQYRAVPGVGFYKGFKQDGFDYFDARGYFTTKVTKYIDVQFGYDKNFIGNGQRSLFLSDWGNSYLFLKLNTRIWKFNYQNIFMELMPQFIRTTDTAIDRKYAAMHHLSMNVTRWLNIGLFEGVIFGRKNHFDFQYLNPIIFYRHIEGTLGSPDNALAGIDFKANVAKRVQVYGQLLLDEFKLDQIKANTGWWANKWGFQLGAKYIDAFGIPNLDLQVESNRVRPFTYSHNNIISNYTHYNQPLAHPLGSSFQEFIGIVRYQPASKWYLNARVIAYMKGLDSSFAGRNYGSNPFRIQSDYRIGDYGYEIGGGRKVNALNAVLQVSYEFRENLYFDFTAQYRKYKIANEAAVPAVSTFAAGIRLNIARREYDF